MTLPQLQSSPKRFLLLLLDAVPLSPSYVCTEKMEVRYRLDSSKHAEILSSSVRNLANGQLHSVIVSRLAETVSVQVPQTSAITPREETMFSNVTLQ